MSLKIIDNNIYDLFISHKQLNGGQLALVIKLELLKKSENLSIFLDVDDLNNIHDLEENIKKTKNILLLITEGVLERNFVIKELKTALEYNKNIILLWDKEHCLNFPDKDKIHEDIKSILDITAIIWHPEIYLRDAIIEKILTCMNFKINISNNNNINNKNIADEYLRYLTNQSCWIEWADDDPGKRKQSVMLLDIINKFEDDNLNDNKMVNNMLKSIKRYANAINGDPSERRNEMANTYQSMLNIIAEWGKTSVPLVNRKNVLNPSYGKEHGGHIKNGAIKIFGGEAQKFFDKFNL